MAKYVYNGLGYRTGMRQGRTGDTGTGGIPDFGTDGFLPKIPEVWNKETEYILDLTKNYHNLLQKEEDGNPQSYIWDNSMLFMEENVEGYSYLTDMQGSTMRLLDHSGQTSVSYGYDEFGADLFGNQGQFQPFGYTGYQRDNIAGTYYARAREYDAGSGRFTSEDVIKGHAAYPETLNAYGYCWGNPVKYVDRDGEFPEWVNDCVDYVKEWCEENVEVNNSITTTARENFGIMGKYKKVTYSEKSKNKRVNITIDNASQIAASVKYDQKVGNIDVNGNIGVSGSGPQSSYSYSWVDKDEQKHNIKIKADLKSIGAEWKTGEASEGSGFRINLNNFSASEVYTFEIKDYGEDLVRNEEGSYINNSLAILAVAAAIVSTAELLAILGSAATSVAPGLISILFIISYVKDLNYDNDCQI